MYLLNFAEMKAANGRHGTIAGVVETSAGVAHSAAPVEP